LKGGVFGGGKRKGSTLEGPGPKNPNRGRKVRKGTKKRGRGKLDLQKPVGHERRGGGMGGGVGPERGPGLPHVKERGVFRNGRLGGLPFKFIDTA